MRFTFYNIICSIYLYIVPICSKYIYIVYVHIYILIMSFILETSLDLREYYSFKTYSYICNKYIRMVGIYALKNTKYK